MKLELKLTDNGILIEKEIDIPLIGKEVIRRVIHYDTMNEFLNENNYYLIDIQPIREQDKIKFVVLTVDDEKPVRVRIVKQQTNKPEKKKQNTWTDDRRDRFKAIMQKTDYIGIARSITGKEYYLRQNDTTYYLLSQKDDLYYSIHKDKYKYLIANLDYNKALERIKSGQDWVAILIADALNHIKIERKGYGKSYLRRVHK